MPKSVDITGKRYGLLTVLSATKHHSGSIAWKCLCECGNIIVARANNLNSGNTTNCGCIRKNKLKLRNTIHGMRKTPEYTAYCNMFMRCYNPNYSHFDRYGGRGIIVCQRWHESFQNFYDDVGLRPGSGYSLDRRDNDGNYEPGNVRWATQAEQVRNIDVITRNRKLSLALIQAHKRNPGFNRRKTA